MQKCNFFAKNWNFLKEEIFQTVKIFAVAQDRETSYNYFDSFFVSSSRSDVQLTQ